MSDHPVIGKWTLTLAAVEPGNAAIYEVRGGFTLGATNPEVYTDPSGITFSWADGTRTTYYAANLLTAHYEPVAPVAPDTKDECESCASVDWTWCDSRGCSDCFDTGRAVDSPAPETPA